MQDYLLRKTFRHFHTRAAECMGISNATGKRLKNLKQSAITGVFFWWCSAVSASTIPSFIANPFTIHRYSIAVVKNVLGDRCFGRYDNNFDHNLFDHKILVFWYYCALWQLYNKNLLKIFEHLKRVFHREGFERVKLQAQSFKFSNLLWAAE